MDINDKEKLVAAFDHMVENVSEAVHKAEEALAPTVDEMIHNAQVLARELYALSQEEAESLGATLKRDMHKANRTLNQQRKELKDWLSFDLTLVEGHGSYICGEETALLHSIESRRPEVRARLTQVVESAVDLRTISEQMEQEFSRVPPLKISRLNKVDRQREQPDNVEIPE